MLFLSSYAPLFLILALRNSFGTREVAYGFVGLAVLSVLFLIVFLSSARKFSPTKVVAKEVVSRDGEAMSYIVTYLLPFLDVSFTDTANAVSLGVMLLVIAIIYVQSNMIHVNPVLSLLGYHVLDVRAESGKVSTLITRKRYIRPDSEITASPVGDHILVEKRT